MLKIKRIYDAFDASDGKRILVDRLWPRGIKKEDARIDLWLKDIAPSSELRKWFAHDPQKWPVFRQKYLSELKQNKNAVEQVKKILESSKNITLLYAAKNTEHNQAIIIKEFIEKNK